jgi:hypothetical protein
MVVEALAEVAAFITGLEKIAEHWLAELNWSVKLYVKRNIVAKNVSLKQNVYFLSSDRSGVRLTSPREKIRITSH